MTHDASKASRATAKPSARSASDGVLTLKNGSSDLPLGMTMSPNNTVNRGWRSAKSNIAGAFADSDR